MWINADPDLKHKIFYEQRLSRIEDGRIAPTAAEDSEIFVRL